MELGVFFTSFLADKLAFGVMHDESVIRCVRFFREELRVPIAHPVKIHIEVRFVISIITRPHESTLVEAAFRSQKHFDGTNKGSRERMGHEFLIAAVFIRTHPSTHNALRTEKNRMVVLGHFLYNLNGQRFRPLNKN